MQVNLINKDYLHPYFENNKRKLEAEADRKAATIFKKVKQDQEQFSDSALIDHHSNSSFEDLTPSCDELVENNSNISNVNPESYSFECFLEKLEVISRKEKEFISKINQLKTLLTFIDDSESEDSLASDPESLDNNQNEASCWWETSVILNALDNNQNKGQSFQLLFIESPEYDSNTFHEKQFAKEYSSSTFYYVKMFAQEDEQRKTPIMVLRISENAQESEIIHLQSIEGCLSGNDLKYCICYPLCEFFGSQNQYLNDQAKVGKFKLSNIRPIIDGTTWYSKDGFYPVKGHRMLSCKDTEVSQDPIYYFAAVEKVRTTTLAAFSARILKGYPAYIKILNQLSKTYLPGLDKSFKRIENGQAKELTIHDLAQAIWNVAKDKTKVKAQEDLNEFYTKFICYYELKGRHNQDQVNYNLALHVIDSTQFWVKKPHVASLSYDEFTASEHKTFDELIKPYAKNPNIKTWFDLADLVNK